MKMNQHRVFRVTTERDLQHAFDIRRQVFVDEQNVPVDLELDTLDHSPSTIHVLAVNESGAPVGTARFRPYEDGSAKVERVAVLPSTRNSGLGRQIMDYIERDARQLGFHELRLNAQTQAQGFYERLNYIAKGELFYEADIPHVHMRKSL